MSNSSSFKYFTIRYYQVVPPMVLVIGCIGNVLNLVLFTRRTLRSNPCAIYFFLLSITNLISLTFGILPNYLINVYGIDILTTTMFFCRFRFFTVHCSLAISSWSIVLAGIDRFCISSRQVRRRQFSTLKHTQVATVILIIICCIIYSHVLILFTIEQTSTGRTCYAQSGSYRVFYDFFFFATYSFTPPILMVLLGLGTLRNILQARSSIKPQETNATARASIQQNVHVQKKDRQYLKMLLVQLVFTVTLTLPIAIQKLYTTFTEYQVKSSSRIEIENFLADFVRTLTQINSGLSFFLYTLSSTAFRRELLVVILKFIKITFGMNNYVYRRLQKTARTTASHHADTMVHAHAGTLRLKSIGQ
ncbi:unnamed protein product [Adineta ricciae]|uniref:G-protein coupled receptors family 1 profile domain-containing protein n=1 Tax=Adineta ricciae TaxID=249248 RepID=A0A816DNB6_ADIRI|nr:unnamed protein product [Adineta ricciae]